MREGHQVPGGQPEGLEQAVDVASVEEVEDDEHGVHEGEEDEEHVEAVPLVHRREDEEGDEVACGVKKGDEIRSFDSNKR